MKRLTYIILFLLSWSFNSCQNEPLKEAKYDLLISHISNQKTFEGSRSMFFVHAIHQNLKDVEFSLQNAPKFIRLSAENGQAKIIMETPTGSAEEYEFNIIVKKGERETIHPIRITVKKMPENTFYVDTVNGDDNNKGSDNQPWKTLNPLKKLVNSSTTALVLLKKGYYDRLKISGNFKDKIFIMPLSENDVTVGRVSFASAKNIIIAGFKIQGENFDKKTPFVAIDSTTSHVAIRNCEIGHRKAAKTWNLEDWKTKSRNGIFSYGNHIEISSNLITCTYHGLETKDTGCQVSYNIIDRFGGDAIRNTGNDNIFEFNTLKNAVIADYSDPNGNHDDLYQSWTFGKPIKNVILRNNIAVAYDDEDLKFPSKVVQGLVCFDGFAEDWRIEGNLVLIDHPHGITLLGANNCTISDNIVIGNPRKLNSFESPPWMMVEKHKDGRQGHGNIVKNNYVPVLKIGTGEAEVKNNTVTRTEYSSFFVGYDDWDFRVGE